MFCCLFLFLVAGRQLILSGVSGYCWCCTLSNVHPIFSVVSHHQLCPLSAPQGFLCKIPTITFEFLSTFTSYATTCHFAIIPVLTSRRIFGQCGQQGLPFFKNEFLFSFNFYFIFSNYFHFLFYPSLIRKKDVEKLDD